MSWYSLLGRPLLFSLDPERAHDLTMLALRMPGVTALLRTGHHPASSTTHHLPSLSQRLLGLEFANPVGLAAGLDKQGTAVPAWQAVGFGFAEIGTVTPRPQSGNPTPRLFRLRADKAVINRFGFNSDGAAEVARNLAGHDVRRTMRLGINVGRNKDTPNERAVDDYVSAIEALHQFADYFVVNVSSPNTADLRALQQDALLRPLLEQCVAAARRASGRHIPVLVKVSPDAPDDDLLRSIDAALQGGAVGVVATNTTLAREGLKAPPAVTGEAGGLSGAPLRGRANDVCRTIFRHLQGRVPIIGVGGIATPGDAYDRIRSGATLVQIYTALIYEGPAVVRDILDGLAARLDRDGFTTIGEAVGVDAR